jgi:hypothetical protein
MLHWAPHPKAYQAIKVYLVDQEYQALAGRTVLEEIEARKVCAVEEVLPVRQACRAYHLKANQAGEVIDLIVLD